MDPPIRVLYIDDDPMYADQIASALEHENEHIDVITESTAAAAIDLLEAEHTEFDCLVSEYAIPGMNGLALLKQIRRERDELPFILYTSMGNEDLASDAIGAGVTDYIQKDNPEQHHVLANRIVNAVEQHRTTRTAAKSERGLREMAEKSNDALWMFSEDWSELHFVNTAAETIFGLSEEQLYAEPTCFLDAVHPVDREHVEQTMDWLSSGQSADIEYRVNEAEDYGRWVWVKAEPIFEQDGNVDRIVGFARDITERKTREQALQAINDVAVDLNSLETVKDICERSIEASEELLQFDLSVIDTEEDGILSKAAVSNDLAPSNTASFSISEGLAGKTYRTGESFLINDLDSHPDANPQGPFRSAISIPVGSHGVFQAVSEDSNAFEETDLELAELLVSHTTSALDRLAREQRLHHQNERLEEFTRIVSHDLRNPMNVIDGSLELAREENESDHLKTALEALTRMEDIVDDTLTLAREGQMVGEMTRVNLDTIATICWGNLDTKSATLDVVSDHTIRADQDRLRHIFGNLFRNAIEHGGSDVTVRIGGLEEGFYVEDDGPGIPDGDHERIFDAEYTNTGTAGFGLAIVRQVAEAHGWQVRVTDETTSGARFEFSDVEVID